ncbi:hypothetical protein RFI_17405, partial [Reticulomyxa filosa]
ALLLFFFFFKFYFYFFFKNKNKRNNSLSRVHSMRVSQHGLVAHGSPLLRRIHRAELRKYIKDHKDMLNEISLEKFMQSVRKVKPDTVLTDQELNVMFDEWKLCIEREDFKFTDLHELDFLLYHLGLVVSRGLLSKLSVSHLSTLDEDAEQTPAYTGATQKTESFLTPSFMETEEITRNMFNLKSELGARLDKTRNALPSGAELVTTGSLQSPLHEEDRISQHQTIPFTISDLVGEFVDEHDNIIRISAIVDDSDTSSLASGRASGAVASPMALAQTAAAAAAAASNAITAATSALASASTSASASASAIAVGATSRFSSSCSALDKPDMLLHSPMSPRESLKKLHRKSMKDALAPAIPSNKTNSVVESLLAGFPDMPPIQGNDELERRESTHARVRNKSLVDDSFVRIRVCVCV